METLGQINEIVPEITTAPPSVGGFWRMFEGMTGNIGLNTPIKRFLFFASILTAVIVILRPSFAFRQDGYPKRFLKETIVPWWLPGILLGAFFSLFV